MAGAGDGFVVAAFDFDGTISHRDTLLPFLVAVRGRWAVAVALLRLAPRLALMATGRADRGATKERLVGMLLTGHPAEELRAAGKQHASQLVHRLRPGAAERIRWHADRGHELVMISASPTVYLEPLAAELGFDAVLATGLEVDRAGRLTGRLEGSNVRGHEKVARLEAWLDGREPAALWAYGDSSGDRELLARADHAFRVGRGGRIEPA
jgi:HAD superfamily hydrolase (TIGR01490 family)